MMADVAELFELAVAAERNAETLYRGLEARFAHHPKAAAFWHSYAKEEQGHAEWLTRTLERLSPEQRAAPAEPVVIQTLHETLLFSVEKALHTIHTLEDAYQLANELESSETNAIFELLIEHFAPDQRTQTFLRTQLRQHVGNLSVEFPPEFQSVSVRRSIKAQEPNP